MPPRAAALIHALHLRPHPEGGYYREVYRSPGTVAPDDGRPARAALTTIYFLLSEGQHSALHRVASDEVWHHYEGDALDLHWLSADLARCETLRLGPSGPESAPVQVIPAGAWQAARTRGAYTLVGCTVAPGFAFEDFALLRDLPALARQVQAQHPALASFV